MKTIIVLIVTGLMMGCLTGLISGNQINMDQNYSIEYIEKNRKDEMDYDVFEKSVGFFTENNGQWNSDLHYIGKTSFGNVGFGSDSIFYDMRKNEVKKRSNPIIEDTFADQILVKWKMWRYPDMW